MKKENKQNDMANNNIGNQCCSKREKREKNHKDMDVSMFFQTTLPVG